MGMALCRDQIPGRQRHFNRGELFGRMAEPPDGDAVVIDAEGDPVSALRLCRAVRSKYTDDTPPIVMLTPDGSSHRLPAYQAGADVCIGRPFAAEELLAQLRASL